MAVHAVRSSDYLTHSAYSRPAQWAVFTDFDGTIASTDVGETILEHFLGERWRDVADEGLPDPEDMEAFYRHAYSLFRLDESSVTDILADVRLDPDFAEFVSRAEARRVPVVVLSDGFDYYITRLLNGSGLGHLPVYSNRLVTREDGSSQLEFPFKVTTCHDCATCKSDLVRTLGRGHSIAYVGNGPSDRCASLVADLVFAKDALASELESEGVPFVRYQDFRDVTEALAKCGII